MKRGKRILSVLWIAILVFTLAACSSGDGGTVTSGRASSDSASGNGASSNVGVQDEFLIWREVRPSLPETFSSGLSGMLRTGDLFYLWSVQHTEDWTKQTVNISAFKTDDFMKAAEEGGALPEAVHTYTFEMEEGNIETLCADENGTIYLVTSKWEGDKEITALSSSGETVYTREIPPGDGEDYWGGTTMACKDGTLVISGPKGVILYDAANGEELETIRENKENYYGSTKVSALRDDKIVFYCYDNNSGEPFLTEIDLAARKAGTEHKTPDDVGYWNLYAGETYDMLVERETGIHAFNLDENEVVQLVGFADSDILIHNIDQIAQLSDDLMLVLHNEDATEYRGRYGGFGSSSGDDMATLSLLVRVDPSTLPEKEEITLGTSYLTTTLTRQTAAFNRENENYRIRLVDYSAYNTSDNWNGATEQLNNDIISGNLPDMIALDTDMPVESYFAKGVFAELDDYFANDPDLADDVLENVKEAFQYQGKTYVVVPAFQTVMVLAKKSLTGGTDTWTPKDIERIVETNGMEWKNLFGFNVPREQLLQAMFQIGTDVFIDREQHTCDFNSDRFIDLMEFTMHFPSQREYESMEQDFDWEKMQTMWREGEALLSMEQMYHFEAYHEARYATFGEEPEMVGFPLDEKGDGCSIIAEEQIAICANSAHKDICWEFLRSYLLPAYQENIPYGFPVTKSALEKEAEKARTPQTYTDEEGNVQEFERSVTVNGEEVKIPSALTKEDTDAVIAMIGSIHSRASEDETILSIIEEETEAFYAGEKSAQEVAAIIQNRVQLYLDER